MNQADSVIHHVTPRWSDEIMTDPRREPLIVITADPRPDAAAPLSAALVIPRTNGGAPLVLSIACRVGEPEFARVQEPGAPPRMTAWGLERLGGGVWTFFPSIHLPGVLHAYLTARDVPDPAPFLPRVLLG